MKKMCSNSIFVHTSHISHLIESSSTYALTFNSDSRSIYYFFFAFLFIAYGTLFFVPLFNFFLLFWADNVYIASVEYFQKIVTHFFLAIFIFRVHMFAAHTEQHWFWFWIWLIHFVSSDDPVSYCPILNLVLFVSLFPVFSFSLSITSPIICSIWRENKNWQTAIFDEFVRKKI